MRIITILLTLMISCQLFGQSLDTTFFPEFVPYAQNPILNYGDEIAGTPWNDPCVLKENGQYIMYTSGVQGGLNHPNDTLGIYRWLSNDGYSWALNPITPVLDHLDGTYYKGGVETPSVVFYKGEYHMYNTVYTVNNPFEFKISHATSLDGITWQIDANPLLEPSPNYTWMDLIVAEPGVMVKDDTLYLFFSTASSLGGFSIGLVRSIDGVNFIDTIQTAQLPNDVYPNGNDYQGLSTPSPVLVGDTIYLFTDVAQNVFGNNWKQVALHQFKSYGDINKWYHDTIPIHTRSDFPWTNGNFSAEIWGVNALLDGNRLRIWYAGHNISSIDTTGATNDTTYNVYFIGGIGGELHVDSGFWGIGTSEYVFPSTTAVSEMSTKNENIAIQYYLNKGVIETNNTLPTKINIYSVNGQLIYSNSFTESHQFKVDYDGLILINVSNKKESLSKKYFSFTK